MAHRKRSIIAAFCSGLLGLTQVCSAQQQVGVNIHNVRPPQTIESYVSPVGLTLRVEFQWRFIEDAQRGVLSFPDSYAYLDSEVTDAALRGAHVLIILDYGNKFYDGGDLIKSPAGIQAFINYAKFIVGHFKGRVSQFEVWNEWNLNTGSKITPRVWGQASDYVNLLRAVYPAIKATNPDAVVVGGAVGGTDDKWIENFITARGLAYLDALSVHPYVQRHSHTTPNAPVLTMPDSAVGARTAEVSPVPGTPEESIAWLDKLKTRIAAAADGRSISIYVSEVGWPTSTRDFGVPEAVAASYLQRFMLMAHTRTWIGGVWWYDLLDDGPDPSNSEARFGLLRQDGDPKPAYSALLQIKDFLGSTLESTQIIGSNGEIWISGGYGDGTKFLATWMPSDDFIHSQSSTDIAAYVQAGYLTISSLPAGSLGAVPALLTK